MSPVLGFVDHHPGLDPSKGQLDGVQRAGEVPIGVSPAVSHQVHLIMTGAVAIELAGGHDGDLRLEDAAGLGEGAAFETAAGPLGCQEPVDGGSADLQQLVVELPVADQAALADQARQQVRDRLPHALAAQPEGIPDEDDLLLHRLIVFPGPEGPASPLPVAHHQQPGLLRPHRDDSLLAVVSQQPRAILAMIAGELHHLLEDLAPLLP